MIYPTHSTKIAAVVGLLLVCLAGAGACKLRNKIEPDPKLVAAYKEADAVFNDMAQASEGDSTYEGRASAALDALMKEIINQNDRYVNVRQKKDLRDLTLRLGELYARAGSLGFNPDKGSLDNLCGEWAEIKPGLAQFVGNAK